MERLPDLPETISTALNLTSRAIKAGFGDSKVYLFGSYAKGDWLEDSDIDIIVVSEAFEGNTWQERIGGIRKLLPKNVSYEILAYTPAEFQVAKRRSVVVSDASEYWIEL